MSHNERHKVNCRNCHFAMTQQREEQLIETNPDQRNSESGHNLGAGLGATDNPHQIVEEILRGRTLLRPLMGKNLSDVQQKIYEVVKIQLFAEISHNISYYKSTQTPLNVWGRELLLQVWKKCLDDDLLKQFTLEIQQQPQNTVLRRHLLGELVEAIRLSGKLCRPHREKFTPDFYELLYEEAVIRTLAYLCKNIDQYDPERGQSQKFMNWVNFRLDKMVIECRREFTNSKVDSLPNLADLENFSQPAEEDSLLTETQNYIASDPRNCFKKEHIRNRPDANFQAIALARFAGKSWEEISTIFDIKIPTLSSFFQRCCVKFRPQFQKDLIPD
ncbi:hypothetical protein NG798_24345 [Ancylothrix sp. C2]|nr:hypothetical protein [Ancylothrix sp. D3o]